MPVRSLTRGSDAPPRLSRAARRSARIPVMQRSVRLLAALLVAPRLGETQDIRFRERVDVERVVVDVRVLDHRGRPLRGLRPEDFRLKVDGRVVPVESAQWVPASGPETASLEASPPDASDPLPAIPTGRLVVLFFQKDMQSARIV